MAEFTTPTFLENHSEDEIHDVMNSILPSDLDKSQGGHVWNLTRPTALVLAEIYEFILPEVIKLIFPEWAYGEYLDAHAKSRSITRRAATAAIGELTITGQVGVIIPAGSLFSTAAINDEPSVDYATLGEVEIPASGTIKVRIMCTQTGIIGNTTENTIVLVGNRINGLASATNEKAVTGGVDEEDDDSLKERIIEYDRNQGDSYAGSIADYKRWATSVDGVGEATIIPANDNTGLVKIILTDANGEPANEQLCQAVYNYIMQPDDPGSRLAPINAYLSVEPPATISIGVKATVELAPEASIESVKAAYLAALALYLPVALDEGEIKLSRVAAALAGVEGANDFRDVQIGMKTNGSVTYGTANVPITTNQLPAIEEEDLVLTIGTV